MLFLALAGGTGQQKIVAACQKYGVAAGIHHDTMAEARQMIEQGYQFVPLASDSRFSGAHRCSGGRRAPNKGDSRQGASGLTPLCPH